MDPGIVAAIVVVAGGAATAAAGWMFKTRRAKRDADALDAGGASTGELRAASRDVRAELRDIRAGLAAAERDPSLVSEEWIPDEAFQRNRPTLMRAASNDQGDAIEEAYRRVMILRAYVAKGRALPMEELQAADLAVDEALSRLDDLQEALWTSAKAAGRPRIGSAVARPPQDRPPPDAPPPS
jgi:hypothetical protein